MTRSKIFTLFLAFFCVPVFCLAQAQPQAAAPQAATPAVIGPAKLAWVNIQQAIVQCEEGKQKLAALEQFVGQKQTEAETMQKEYETLQNQLKVQGPKLNPEALADLNAQIESQATVLQRFQQDTQKEITNRDGRVRNSIGRKMLPIMEAMSLERGLSAVLFIDQQLSIYGYINPTLVLTDELIRRYNEKHPVVASSASQP
jgi:Skp family chaperone for outer membrane proteins